MTLKTISDTFVRRMDIRDKSWHGPTQIPSVNTVNTVNLSLGRTRTTENQTPGWRKRIAKGENATTFLSGSVDSVTYRPGVAWRYLYDKSVDVAPDYGQSYWEVTGPMTFSSGTPPASVPNSLKIEADNAALSRYIKRINEVHSAFKGGTFLGELRESLHMVLRPGQIFRREIGFYVQDARRFLRKAKGKRLPLRTRHRVLRDTWLEYSFGWKPLMSDVKSGFDALLSLNEDVNEFASGKAGRNVTTSSTQSGSGGTINSSVLSWSYEESQSSDYLVRYFGKANVKTMPGGWRLASQTFGFRLEEFLPTVWELIPYSFLVDYFTNIGDVIQAYSTLTSSVKWTAKTIRDERITEWVGFKLNKLGLPQYQIRNELFVPPTFSRSAKNVLRSNYVGSLVPQFEFQLPGFGLKWLNIAALAKMRRA